METVTMALSLHGASWMRGVLALWPVLVPFMVVPIAFSLLYWVWTTALLWRRGRDQENAVKVAAELPPIAFLRPVKLGLPALEEKAALLLQAARPGDWVLFGVADAADQRRCQQAIAVATPAGVRAEVVPCDFTGWKNGASFNPKVHKLEALTAFLERESGPEHWILTDCEILADGPSFDRFRGEWQAAEAHAAQAGGKGVIFTAGYRFAGCRSALQKLDHLPALLTLWPGLVASEWGMERSTRFPGFSQLFQSSSTPSTSSSRPTLKTGLGFTLGACIALRQRDIAIVGGWRAFRDYLAEDNRLGAALAAQGVPTYLSREIFTLDADPLTLVDWVRHQHRVSLTYRVCNPLGFLGMVLTFGVPWALLFAVSQPHSWLAWGVLALVMGVRLVTAAGAARALAFPVEKRRFRFAGHVFVVSLAEGFFWLAAWLPLPVWWGRRGHRVTRDGKFSSGTPHFIETSLASEPALNYQSDV